MPLTNEFVDRVASEALLPREVLVKRAVVLFLVLGMVVGGITTAEAKKKKKKPAPRVVTTDYAPASDGGSIIIAPATAGVSVTQVPFVPLSTEKKVSVVIADDAGQPVRARISQSESNLTDYFCGKTDAPVSVAPGVEIFVEIFSGPCGSGVSVATQGTVTATFTQ